MKLWKWEPKQEELTFVMLILALITLFYGIHRSYVNQQNQTALTAGFRMLEASNKLQTLVHKAHYDRPEPYTHYSGWEHILLIKDLSLFMDERVQKQAKLLALSWRKSTSDLKHKKNVSLFLKQLNAFRTSVRTYIKAM